jgi:hypothetical protein
MEEHTATHPQTEVLQERFALVLSLPAEKLYRINEWAKTHLDIFHEGSIRSFEAQTTAAALDISRRELLNAVNLIGNFLLGGDLAETLNLVINDTSTHDIVSKTKILLSGIKTSPEKSAYLRERSHALYSILPTYDIMHVACDLRAIFRKHPGPDASAESEKNIKDFVDYEPIVIVNMSLSDAEGNDQTYNFQMTEKNLREMLNTLQQTLIQLQIVKQNKE